MAPSEWAVWMDGHMLREEDEWRRTRAIYALIYNTNVDRHHQMRAEELIPLPGDSHYELIETPVRYLTDEEREKLLLRDKIKE
jgi:hypothetical protein